MIITALILGSCLGAVLVLLVAWRRRTGIYRYDVRRDQHYEFPPSRTVRITGELMNGTLRMSPPAPPAGVVLLELRIRSTPLGRWFEPHLDLETSDRRWRQPFERGASGLRYVDISQIVRDAPTTLRLTGHHLSLRDQTVVLHALQSVDLDRQKLLVLGTHPDDAEIAAFGAYADREAYVVTLTAGEAGELGPFARFSGAAAYREKGGNRAWNSIAVPMLGGVPIERTVNLGYFDGTLTRMRERPETPVRSTHAEVETLEVFGRSQDPRLVPSRTGRRATWAHLVADLEHLVKTVRPDILVAPYPRLDAHPDHKMTTAALIEALKNLDWRSGSLLLYTNHLCSSDRYPYGDAGDLVGLPPGIGDIFFDGIASVALDSDKQSRKHMALDAMIDLRPATRIDSVRCLAKALWQAVKWTVTDGQTSYFRQAVRANELFFEVRVSSLYEPGVTERLLG